MTALPTHGRYAYSALPDRPVYLWPNGARLAVYFVLGVEAYRFGEGVTEDLLPGVPQPDMVNTSWRDYGNRVGAWRILDRFRSLDLPLGILLNTAAYDETPQLTDAFRSAGCEIVAHGISNSDTLAGMSEEAERAYIRSVAEAIRAAEGRPPAGWSSPWLAHTPRTLDLLAEAGFSYLLDLGLDDQPVWLRAEPHPLLALPYALELNDSSSIIGRHVGAEDFAGMIIDQFEELLLTPGDQPLVMSVVIHSFISGQPFRLRALTRALRHIAERRDQLWLAQPGAIAAFVAADPTRAP